MDFHRQLNIQIIIIAMLTSLLGLSACDDDMMQPYQPNTDRSGSGEFWYTRTMSRAEKMELKRKFGLGFSFDAIYGGKCDMRFVRCQVLNYDSLYSEGLVDIRSANQTVDSTVVAHSFSDYCQVTDLTAQVSGGVPVFSADYKKVSAVFEHGMDTVVCFYNKRNIERQRLKIDTTMVSFLERADIDRLITPSFRYGIEKIKRSSKENVMVVDSFINIFGSHVIIDVNIGAQLTLDVKTRRGLFFDYISEETITKEQLNLLFFNKENKHTEKEKQFIKQVIDNSTMELRIIGGDLSSFNSLIVNPVPTNPAATVETLNQWSLSLKYDESNPFESNLELIDMSIAPIWMFIPDEEVAARVKTRIIADAPTMQELYGNKNWINTRIDINSRPIKNYYSNGTKTVTETPWVVNVVSANRIIATICREWVPEISKNETVTVVYPIYENKVDLSGGLCTNNGKAYRVSWRYDRFIVNELDDVKEDMKFAYLTFGCLSFEPTDGQSYQDAEYLIGYEWPGSLDIDGKITTSSWYRTRKFLGDFYLETDKKFNDLPNWEYVSTGNAYPHYSEELKVNRPYELSGIKIQNKDGAGNIHNRMIRCADYHYYINRKEMWYAN